MKRIEKVYPAVNENRGRFAIVEYVELIELRAIGEQSRFISAGARSLRSRDGSEWLFNSDDHRTVKEIYTGEVAFICE